MAENPFRTAILEVQNGILDPPDTGDLPHHKRMEQICDNITEEVDRRMIVKKYYSRRSAIHEVMMEVGTKVYSEPWKEGG